MKITAALTLLATAGVMAAPADLDERQLGGSSTRTDLEDGNSSDCPSTILIFARATGERGNIVSFQSTHTADNITKAHGFVKNKRVAALVPLSLGLSSANSGTSGSRVSVALTMPPRPITSSLRAPARLPSTRLSVSSTWPTRSAPRLPSSPADTGKPASRSIPTTSM